ncbi:rhomboid-like protein [Rhodococcoides yunnanense]|uniref:rhomboid-like protein n=1 Tax=Rhodococcoides yunnanense TaxID=278209 RepID=UPI000932FA5A|nr:rhomboid-like protein [Rhodococcus yunnanensis]
MPFLAALTRLKVTIAYFAIALSVTAFLAHLHPRTQWHVLLEASTNLHNLGDGHIGTLVASAFLTDGEPNWLWLGSIAVLFVVAEWVSGSRRFLLTAAAGHVGATSFVAVGLVVGIHADWLADSLAVAVDVGVSYAAAAVAGSMIRYLRPPWRAVWVAGWIAFVTAAAVSDPSFTAFGHALALSIGFMLGAVYIRIDAQRLILNRSRQVAAERVQPEHAMTSL